MPTESGSHTSTSWNVFSAHIFIIFDDDRLIMQEEETVLRFDATKRTFCEKDCKS